jgi:thioredoxin-disulfide reductase
MPGGKCPADLVTDPHELIIIGAGPAGITAAVYAARKRLRTIVLTKDVGGQAAISWSIENYPGYKFISGPDLSKRLEEHLKSFDFCLHLQKELEVKKVREYDDLFQVQTDKGNYAAKTVIIATGAKYKKLGVPGEKKFEGKGVSYCATCDAPLFSGKKVAVIGGGNSALEATLQLTSIAEEILLVTKNPEMKGEEILVEKVKESEKVRLVHNALTKKIKGDKFVKSIVVDVDGKQKSFDVQGVFVEIGQEPVKIPVNTKKELETNEWNEIVVDEHCATSVPGLFAAVDVTSVPEKQIVVAAGQGCIAALSAARLLTKEKE